MPSRTQERHLTSVLMSLIRYLSQQPGEGMPACTELVAAAAEHWVTRRRNGGSHGGGGGGEPELDGGTPLHTAGDTPAAAGDAAAAAGGTPWRRWRLPALTHQRRALLRAALVGFPSRQEEGDYRRYKAAALRAWDRTSAAIRLAAYVMTHAKVARVAAGEGGAGLSTWMTRLPGLIASTPPLLRLLAGPLYERHRESLEFGSKALNVALALPVAALSSVTAYHPLKTAIRHVLARPAAYVLWNQAMLPVLQRMVLPLHVLSLLARTLCDLVAFGGVIYVPGQVWLLLLAAGCVLGSCGVVFALEVRLRGQYLAAAAAEQVAAQQRQQRRLELKGEAGTQAAAGGAHGQQQGADADADADARAAGAGSSASADPQQA